MADWHLADVDAALTAAGWRIIAHHAGDDRRVSASWEIQRSTRQAPLFIDFDGQDDMQCLPLSESYGCEVRGIPRLSLYFGKKGGHWKQQLSGFVAALDEISRTPSP